MFCTSVYYFCFFFVATSKLLQGLNDVSKAGLQARKIDTCFAFLHFKAVIYNLFSFCHQQQGMKGTPTPLHKNYTNLL